jgi:hypothetical protein
MESRLSSLQSGSIPNELHWLTLCYRSFNSLCTNVSVTAAGSLESHFCCHVPHVFVIWGTCNFPKAFLLKVLGSSSHWPFTEFN